MSWLFSQALVAASSAAICLDGEPSSQLNVMPTPHKFWRNDKTMDASDLSQFGLTLRLLTEDHGQALLTSYLAGFRARTFQPLAVEQGSAAHAAASGRTWQGSFSRYDLSACSWKTAQSSLLGDSDEYSATWPRWGSMRNGASYLRPIPALTICANESGLWPTPTVFGNHDQPGASKQAGWGLSSAVKQWATPTASPWRSGKASAATRLRNSRPLSEQVVARMYPTPTAGSAKSGGTMQEWGGSKNWGRAEDRDLACGQLNPEWVEWLMGWPIGWTELKPLGMDRFREWQQQHSPCSGAERDFSEIEP